MNLPTGLWFLRPVCFQHHLHGVDVPAMSHVEWLPIGTATYELWNSKSSPISSCSNCTWSSSSSNRTTVPDWSILDVTLHFTHVTWPVGIKTLSRFTLNRPHSVGCSGVCTKPTRVWASSLDTAIALESNESKVWTKRSCWPWINSSTTLKPSNGLLIEMWLTRKGTLIERSGLSFPCKLTVMTAQPSKGIRSPSMA